MLSLKNLISVSGCGHAGTTLTATVLGAHENLLLIPEETRMFLGSGYNIDEFILKHYNEKINGIIEKTPNHVYVVDKIKQLHPETRFIANIRDPRDIAASLYKRFDNWDVAISRLTKDFKHIKLFYEDLYIVRYENIVNDFENTFKQVCAYLNIEFDEKMLNYHEHSPNWFKVENPQDTNGHYLNGLHESRRAWQVKQPLFDGSGRWKKELNNKQISDLSKNIGDLAGFFGYDI